MKTITNIKCIVKRRFGAGMLGFSQNPFIVLGMMTMISIGVLLAGNYIYKKYKENKIISAYAEFLQELNAKTAQGE